MSEGAEESNHALDAMDLDPKKRGFLRWKGFLEGTGDRSFGRAAHDAP